MTLEGPAGDRFAGPRQSRGADHEVDIDRTDDDDVARPLLLEAQNTLWPMAERRVLPYGSWPSTIDIQLAVSSPVIAFAEARRRRSLLAGGPADRRRQAGRRSASADGRSEDVTAAGFNVRTRAHEYGGGEYLVDSGIVYFSNFEDGRLYRQPGRSRRAAYAGRRHAFRRYGRRPRPRPADLRGRGSQPAGRRPHLAARGWTHPRAGELLARSTCQTGAVDAARAGLRLLQHAALSPDGRRLPGCRGATRTCPGTAASCGSADLDADGSLATHAWSRAARTSRSSSPTGRPMARSSSPPTAVGWWNLYRWRRRRRPRRSRPWRPSSPVRSGSSGCAASASTPTARSSPSSDRGGVERLWAPEPGAATPGIELARRSEIAPARGRRRCVAAFVARRPTSRAAVVRLDLASGARQRAARRVQPRPSTRRRLSMPQHIEFPTTGGRTALRPLLPADQPAVRPRPTDERPPLIVMSPRRADLARLERPLSWSRRSSPAAASRWSTSTTAAAPATAASTCTGSTAQWGVVDLDDCINAARYLAERGAGRPAPAGHPRRQRRRLHDALRARLPRRLRGRRQLLRRRRPGGAGARHAQVRVALPRPPRRALPGRRRAVYRERSPIHFSGRSISCPVIVLQGADDMVVPQAQADELVAALRAQRVPLRLPAVPGRRPRLPPGGRTSASLPARPSCRSTRRSSASSSPTPSSRSRWSS